MLHTGYYEIRCKVDYIIGAWSAFWMMPDNEIAFSKNDIQNTGADGSEIDIMESNWSKNYTGHVVHYDGYNENLKSINSGGKRIKNLHTQYHKFALEWTPQEYIFYIDDKETWRTNKMGISNVDQYMIISNEVGGYYDEDSVHSGINADGSKFWFGNVNSKGQRANNYDFVIDYVRVYAENPYTKI